MINNTSYITDNWAFIIESASPAVFASHSTSRENTIINTRQTNTKVVAAIKVNLCVIGEYFIERKPYSPTFTAWEIISLSLISEEFKPMKKPAMIQPMRSDKVLSRGKCSTRF